MPDVEPEVTVTQKEGFWIHMEGQPCPGITLSHLCKISSLFSKKTKTKTKQTNKPQIKYKQTKKALVI
jgi:ribulose kinase